MSNRDRVLIKQVTASGGMWCKTTFTYEGKGNHIKEIQKQEWFSKKPSVV